MNGQAFGCGQCLPCRVNRRRIWTHRIMLEAAQYKDNSFVTLTYDEEKLPSDLSVSPRTLQLFMKRLRKVYPVKLRYFGCGEYGDQTMRPHYHLALFNFASCERGQTRFSRHGTPCCAPCSMVAQAWGFGNVMLGTLEPKSMAYVAGYVTKKMTSAGDPRLEGRLPEFARMSLRPGIGLGMMDDLASVLMEHKLDEKMIDVPTSLQHGTKQWPLGRYLRRKLRARIGRDENTPYEEVRKRQEEMQPLREVAWNNEKPLSEVYLQTTEGKRIQIEARESRKKRHII